MPLEPIQVYEVDRATSRLEQVGHNPTRMFLSVPLGPDGKWTGSPALYIWQNGQWYDTGENPIPEETVPQKFQDEIKATPVTVAAHGPKVTWVCPVCKERMNTSDQEQHLVGHVDTVMKAAGTPTPVKADANKQGRPA